MPSEPTNGRRTPPRHRTDSARPPTRLKLNPAAQGTTGYVDGGWWPTDARPEANSGLAQIYLEQIGHLASLNAEDEAELAEQSKAGLEAAERLGSARVASLTAAERGHLGAVVKDGECARNKLVQGNLALVVLLAEHYAGRGQPVLDLIQDGNLGLMRAALHFDHATGYPFRTYAIWSIRQALIRAVSDGGRAVRLPTHIVYLTNKLASIRHRLAQDLGHEPSQQQLAIQMDVGLPRLREIQRYASAPVSLDQLLAAPDATPLVERIEDTQARTATATSAAAAQGDRLRALLGELPEREADVLRLRFGLVDGQRRTLGQIGKTYGISREQVRHIELAAMTKLRGADPHLRSD